MCVAPVRCADNELAAKEPQRDCLSWFAPSGEPATDKEMLFFALLQLSSGMLAGDTEIWAKEVLTLMSEFDRLGPAFKLPDEPKWRMAGSKPGAMLAPMNAAYNGTTWTEDRLERIGAAMQAYRGPGRVNGLDAGRLKSHKAAKLTGERALGGKNQGSPRWRTPQTLIGVARGRVSRHVSRLRSVSS